ncbi:uncharacterized protein LOC127721991 [Mytilus californianus]|uniref:uncharacterized protein LOC127721991 n=1 Tax=Mytilus californianus TaxID=6549 RepID=UPI0022454EBD|nr:uncharacterized protein LOC127721991 [Mytilus californianus]
MNVIKVLCLGNCQSKKTELLGVLSEDKCKYDELANIHNKMKSYLTCNLAITADFNIEILIFSSEDTDSLNLYNLRRMGYDQAEVMLLVFDVDNPETLRDIQDRWIDECFIYARTAKILLVGVQSDTIETTAAIQRTIEYIRSHHQLEYREVSLKTRKGATECLMAIAELACRENSNSKRRSVGDGFSTIMKKGTRMLYKLLPEKQEKQNTEQDKDRRIYQIQELASLKEQSELHAIFKKHEKQIFRHFIVEKVLPLQILDLKSFGTALGYDPTALKLPKECLEIIKNPYWQMLKFWTEQTENLQCVCLPLMYCSLMNIKQKVIANDLIKSVMAHYTDKDIITKIDKKFHQGIETDEMLKLKAKLKLFMFSQEADQTPPVIWKIGKSAGALYKDILQAGTESRHCIRLMIVGPFGVGKTCLMRRLLKKDIRDVKSTNGINIMVLKCKVRLSDGTWIFSDELVDHTKQNLQWRLYKNLYQRKQQIPRQSDSPTISYNQTNVPVKEQPLDRNDTCLSTTKTHRNCYSLYRKEHKAVKENPNNNESSKSNSERNTRIAFQKSEESLLKDFDGLKLSTESMDDFAEVVMLDFAGQYEFYATHQTFLNKHAIYLLVLDISKDLKGIAEDLDNALPDLAEIPLKDIGEYVNFWMDAIHCYSENEVCEDKSKQDHPSADEDKSKQNLPSVIVVGTCSDKLEEGKEKSRQKEIEKQLNEILGGHVKSKHIKDLFYYQI